MREISLLRHGDAEPWAAGGDAARPLSAGGRAQIERVAAGLARHVRVDAIWHSPLLRAVETASLVGAGLGCDRLVEDARLIPGGDAERVASALRSDRTRRLLVVSHLPFLPALTAALLEAPARIDLGTGGFVQLALLGDGPAYLRAQVPADLWS